MPTAPHLLATAHYLGSIALLFAAALPTYGQQTTDAALGYELHPTSERRVLSSEAPGTSNDLSAADAPSTRGLVALGTVLGNFTNPDPPIGKGDLAVGLDAFEGNLLSTEVNTDFFFSMDTSGTLVLPAVSLTASTNGLIGIADSPEGFWITDVANQLVSLFTLDGTLVRSFSTLPNSTFPEGIDLHFGTGNIFVADGGGNNVAMEFEPDGTLVSTYPINGTSQDGLAFDPVRCSFWIYDSGTDTVRHYFYDGSSMTEQETFPGTIAAGFGNGEGLAVMGDRLFLASANSNAVVEFDISAAASDANNALCGESPFFADGFESGDVSVWSASAGEI